MLYIVGTPIGNLKDITERALEILRTVPVIIMESPQDSMRLVRAYALPQKEIIKYNERNRKRMEAEVLTVLQEKDAAYITSAGMPGISDPGEDLVRLARAHSVPVNVVPGPSALTAALALSGLPIREFSFISFPPKKEGQLKKLFVEYAERKTTLVFFESPFRIVKTIAALEKTVPDVRVFVAKELTKMFENSFEGMPADVLAQLATSPKNTKGEFVVVVAFG
ncbi:MAG: 16S rRNA (cytidine(1402)-2'-O)-methyltransferase [Candidatus Paceibacterota bacterium]|jgi:16S rRNA (cytidine1402-2'-O)-methyltransferase